MAQLAAILVLPVGDLVYLRIFSFTKHDQFRFTATTAWLPLVLRGDACYDFTQAFMAQVLLQCYAAKIEG